MFFAQKGYNLDDKTLHEKTYSHQSEIQTLNTVKCRNIGLFTVTMVSDDRVMTRKQTLLQHLTVYLCRRVFKKPPKVNPYEKTPYYWRN